MQLLASQEEAGDIQDKFTLSKKQALFAMAMVTTGNNRRKSLDLAGYNYSNNNSAAVVGSKLMSNPKVVAAISYYRGHYLKDRKNKIESDVFEISHTRATFNPKSLASVFRFDTMSQIADAIENLDDDVAMCIDSMEIQLHPKNENRAVLRIGFASKDKAIQTLIKLTGLEAASKQEVHHTGNAMPNININVMAPAPSPEPKMKKAKKVEDA